MKKIKLFPEKSYNQIIDEVGSYRYAIYGENEPIPGDIFSRILRIQNYNCVIAGTGSTASLCNLKIHPDTQITIPQNSPVIIVRLLRLDKTHDEKHYNADDQTIFPTTDGHVFRLPRNDAPDHFLKIADTANMITLADAYRLPEKKAGPIEKYSEKGAKLHINLVLQKKHKNKDKVK